MNIYFFKVIVEKLEKGGKYMFKVIVIKLFISYLLIVNFEHISHLFLVFIVDFQQVNTS